MRNYEEHRTQDGKSFLAIGVELGDGRKFERCAELGIKNFDKLVALLRESREQFISRLSTDSQR